MTEKDRRDHSIDITATSDAGIRIGATYGNRVPDLLAPFPEAVRKKAQRFRWWPSRYELRMWRASKNMSPSMRKTVRQHILLERAMSIEEQLLKRAERRQAKADRQLRDRASKAVGITARHLIGKTELPKAVEPKSMMSDPSRSLTQQADEILGKAADGPSKAHLSLTQRARPNGRSALAGPERGSLTLSAQAQHGSPMEQPGVAPTLIDWSRGRGR